MSSVLPAENNCFTVCLFYLVSVTETHPIRASYYKQVFFTHVGETGNLQIHVRLHVQQVFRRSDQPDAIISFYSLADHVHHRDGTAQILYIPAAIGDGLYRLVVRMTDHEGIKGLVTETSTAIGIKSYQ